jgi:hypothetical protein
MNDDVVEDKRRLDSCRPRETLADQGRLTAPFRRASLWSTLALGRQGIIFARRPISVREKMRK